MSEKPAINSCITFAKIVSGNTAIENNIIDTAVENNMSPTTEEKNIHNFNNNLTLTEKNKDSQEDWPSLEHDETSPPMQCMISPSAGSRKLPKNNWKKVDINVDYNTAQEVFMSRKGRYRNEQPAAVDRPKKIFERGGGGPPPRRNHFTEKDREEPPNRQNKHFDHRHPQQRFRSEQSTHHGGRQRSATGKIQNEENKSQQRKEEEVLPEEKQPIHQTKINEDEHNKQMKDKEVVSPPQSIEQNQQQKDTSYWYFDDVSNGYYYQHSGSQGWKKNTSKQRQQQRTVTEYNKTSSSRHSPNQSQQNSMIPQTEQQTKNNKMASLNSQIAHQRPIIAARSSQQFNSTATETNRNNNLEGETNNFGGGYNRNNKRIMAPVGGDQEQQQDSSSHFTANNNAQWASTSGVMRPSHHQQNGVRGGGNVQRQPYNKPGGDHQRRSAGGGGPPDYWKKNGGNGDGNNSINYNTSKEDEQRRARSSNNSNVGHQYYNNSHHHHHQRYNNNNGRSDDRERWSRQPLPDWEEVVQEAGAGGEERFDYMDLMENQYSQYYALAPVPTFDPSLGMMAIADPNSAAFSTGAALTSNYLLNGMALASFQPGFMVTAQPQPPTASIQAINAAAAQSQLPQTHQQQQQEMNSNSHVDSNAIQPLIPPAVTAIVQQTIPPPIVTSSTIHQQQQILPHHQQPVPSPTPPPSLLSPNGLIHFPLPAVAAHPLQTIVVSADHPHHQQMPQQIASTNGPFPANMLATHQFPLNQNAALFTTGAAVPSNNFVPFLDESKLKELVRGQIEYYFSADNLAKDFFLRRKMDVNGFLPLDLIASFPRIRNLTINLGFIVDSLRDSEKVELSEDQQKVRPRHAPLQWPLFEPGTAGTTAENSPIIGGEEKDAKHPDEMQQQNTMKINKNLADENEEGGKEEVMMVKGEKSEEGQQKLEESSVKENVELTEYCDYDGQAAKEEINEKEQQKGEPSNSDLAKQTAEQQNGHQEDDDNWMEVKKTKRSKRNNNRGGNGASFTHHHNHH